MASGASLWRGLDYVEQGRVKNLRPVGKGAFDAEVEGSANLPYTVQVPSRFLRTFRQPHRPALRCGYPSSSVTSR